MNAVPAGWTFAPLTDVVDHKSGNSKIIKGKQSNEPKPGLIQGFSASGPDIWVADQEYESEGVVVSAVGARCGKTFYATGAWTPIANTHALMPKTGVRPRFLWYLTNRETWWIKGGTAQPFVRVKQTLEREQLLPPPVEQDEIVRILDTQFARLDTVLTAVQAVRDKADQFRRSLLHAAFTGELTGEAPSEFVQLADVAELTYGFTDSATQEPIGPRFLRITDTHSPNIDWSEVPFCSADESELEKFGLQDGDIVFARTGASTGRSTLIRKPPSSVFASYLIRVRLSKDEFTPAYVAHYFTSPTYWSQISAGTTGTAQGGFNAKKLGGLEIPVFAKNIQVVIADILDTEVARLVRALEMADRVEAECGRLRRSLLQAAFTGELTRKWREANV